MRHCWSVLMFWVCLCGCAEQADLTGQRVPVSGMVLIDGQPLGSGIIRFVPTGGRPVSGSIRSDGSFQLHEYSISHEDKGLDVLPGRYRVEVSATERASNEIEMVRWLAPSKYADFRSSGVEVEVGAASDDLLIELSWEDSESISEALTSTDVTDPIQESLPKSNEQTELKELPGK